MASLDTRSVLLRYIVEHGGATVAQLAQALPLADATVRRHLDKLEVETLVSTDLVRQGPGRPYHVYQATDAGVRRDRDHSSDLAARLLTQIKAGHTDPDAVAEGVAEAIVAPHRATFASDAPLDERVAQTVQLLRNEGILDGWNRDSDGIHLHNHACPYRSAADASDCVCESDRLAIEKLLGMSVEQVGSLVQGDAACEYLVPASEFPAQRAGPSENREHSII